MNNRRWNRSELLLAIDLYCRTAFGKIHKNNKEIIELAKLIHRTPDALALKMCNFASLDPTLDRHGLSNYSRLDKEVWQEVFDDWSILEQELPNAKVELGIEPVCSVIEGKETLRLTKRRNNQNIFRSMILASYNYKCALTSINISKLLVASHIIPWAISEKDRLNPCNGICLNSLHDQAFDKGLISFDQDLRVVLSSELKSNSEPQTAYFLNSFEGKQLTAPARFLPSKQFLEFHRNTIFTG